MIGLPVLLAEINDLWYALPLIVSVSLVYAATRHEAIDQIVRHATRIGAWILGFMLIVFAVLWVISEMVSAG
jgi:Na+/alanine symporter